MSTKDGCRVCVAAIGLEAMAALQLAQPSLGKMAVKEPAQPFWCHIPRLALIARETDRAGHAPLFPEANSNRFEQRPPSMLEMQQELS